MYQHLLQQPLFQKLTSDPDVFMAVRRDCLSFYYKGAQFFKYENGQFRTDQKFAMTWPESGPVKEGTLFKGSLSSDFVADYEGIKRNIDVFAKGERPCVHQVALKGSYRHAEPVSVIDVEKNLLAGGKGNEVDLVLLKGSTLRFVEAKLYESKKLFDRSVFLEQVPRYERLIKEQGDRLLEYYRTTVDTVNGLFGTKLAYPEHIEPKVVVLIVDYERCQYEARLGPLLESPGLEGHLYYAVGDPAQCSLEALFAGKRCGPSKPEPVAADSAASTSCA